MKQKTLRLIVAVGLLFAFNGSSTAALITFTIPDGLNTQGTVSIVSSGTTLNLFNPLDAFGNASTFTSSNNNGLFFSNQAGGLHDFNFTFDKFVGIVSYVVGSVPNGDIGSFNLTTSPVGGSSSLNNAVGIPGSSLIVGTYALDTFQTGLFDTFDITDGSNNGFPPSYQILSITVDDFQTAPVPVPSAILFLGTGLISLVGWRRRSRKAI